MHYTVHVQLNAKSFRRFTLFDTFFLKKKWVSPCVFSLIFLFFSALCFFFIHRDQSALLGTVLLIVGLGLPAAYFLQFFLQMHDQSKRFNLKKGRPVYTVELDEQHIVVHNDMKKERSLDLKWKKLFAAWRVKDAIYLYAAPHHAFILPSGQSDCTDDELWKLISSHMAPDKVHTKL